MRLLTVLIFTLIFPVVCMIVGFDMTNNQTDAASHLIVGGFIYAMVYDGFDLWLKFKSINGDL